MNKIIKKIKTAWNTLSEEGMLAFLYKFKCIYYPNINIGKDNNSKYQSWIKKNEKAITQKEVLAYEPLISNTVKKTVTSRFVLILQFPWQRENTLHLWIVMM